MNKRRLIKLAGLLETVRPRDFTIMHFVSRDPDQGDCGFAGCAIGWAAYAKLVRGLSITNGIIALRRQGKAEIRGGLSVAGAAFAIDGDDARSLFMPSGYDHNPTPKQVAKRIRKFVESGHV